MEWCLTTLHPSPLISPRAVQSWWRQSPLEHPRGHTCSRQNRSCSITQTVTRQLYLLTILLPGADRTSLCFLARLQWLIPITLLCQLHHLFAPQSWRRNGNWKKKNNSVFCVHISFDPCKLYSPLTLWRLKDNDTITGLSPPPLHSHPITETTYRLTQVSKKKLLTLTK